MGGKIYFHALGANTSAAHPAAISRFPSLFVETFSQSGKTCQHCFYGNLAWQTPGTLMRAGDFRLKNMCGRKTCRKL